MKILIVQDTDWIRRNPIQHTHLAERMQLRGHEIRAIDYEILWKEEGKKELFSKRQEYTVSRVTDGKVKVIRPGILKIPLLDYISMIFTYSGEIRNQIKEFNPDIMFGNDILTTYLAYRIAKKHNIPTVFYSIDIDHRLIPYGFLQKIGKFMESKNIKDADFVLSINEGLRDYTINMGAKPENTAVIRAGIDTGLFSQDVEGKRIKEKYGIRENDKVLFFMGWLYHFSGLKELAEDLIKIKEQRPDIKLLLIGDGDAYDDLKKIQEENHLEEQMILTGKIPYEELPEYISCADICLLPAYNNEIMRDIVPIKLYEYMAMGKPVISTKLPGVMKEFGDNNGMIFVDNPEDVMSKSIEILSDGTYLSHGRNAYNFVKNSDWELITDEFERKMEELK